MKRIQTEILVIGGGATGAGVLCDLSLRGFKATLVEKNDFSTGTTGRYHGLLHSGGRYVVKDPQAAIECIHENSILRKIMPHCIEDTGGFFVLTPWDDPEYAYDFMAGCQEAGVPFEDVPINRMLQEEPRLNPQISHCFRVPDASADSFLGTLSNIEAAKLNGGQVYNYFQITKLISSKSRVMGAICHDLINNELVEIHADCIVNATGAWVGKVASLIGIQLDIIPSKGTMLAMNHRLVNTVINRCKLPSDGDILVPAHTVSVMGTTDIQVQNPDNYSIEPWEVQLMLKEGEKIIPGFKDQRVLRAWAGIRPLYQEEGPTDSRDVSRAFVLLDHEDRDGIEGFITITSGKWTTYRKMAEVTVNLVCEKLRTWRPCRTHLEVLPDPTNDHSKKKSHVGKEASKPIDDRYNEHGERLADIEEESGYGRLVCECELTSYADIHHAILNTNAKTIDDLRRSTRVGMGPCQGGFCTYRVAGIMHDLRHQHVYKTNLSVREFLQERWKGLIPILWGRQLQQERLDELIYLSLFNADHLPGERSSAISPIFYEHPTETAKIKDNGLVDKETKPPALTIKGPISRARSSGKTDVLVIGAGLAGLTAAWRAADKGYRVRLISNGHGALHWHTGCIDILGYSPAANNEMLASPREGLKSLFEENPEHPYSLVGIENIQRATLIIKELSERWEYPLHGDLEKNWLLPSAMGVPRPTCLAPETMIHGDLQDPGPALVIGFDNYLDFYPGWVASNLGECGIAARGITLELESISVRKVINARILADLFEQQEFLEQACQAIKATLDQNSDFPAARIGFPAVLGIDHPLKIKDYLETEIGLPIFEIPTLPPSIPGIRLSRMFINAFRYAGGRFFEGMEAVGSKLSSEKHIRSIFSEAAARDIVHQADNIILATGGILGAGIRTDYRGCTTESIFNLSIPAPGDRNDWFIPDFLSSKSHPIFQVGIPIDHNFQPTDKRGEIIYRNLFAIGTGLAGGDYIRERSFDGVALVSGFSVGESI